MPAKLYWKDDYFVIAYSGFLRINEALEIYDHLTGSGDYYKSKFGIIDCTEVEGSDYKERTYDLHAAYSKVVASHLHRNKFRVGVVVASKEIEEKVEVLVNTTKKYLQAWERKIFWDMEEAKRWASYQEGED